MRPTPFLLAAIVLALPAHLAAQVPSGTHLYSTGVDRRSTVTLGCGGLFLIGPLHPTPTPITGLPPDVTPCATGPSNAVRNFAVEDPATGDVFAKGGGNLYRLRIHAPSASATVLTTYVIGQGGFGHAVPMPDGRLLLMMSPNLSQPGLFGGTGALLGILDPTLPPNALQTPVPVAPIPAGSMSGVAVTADGSQAMIAFTDATSNTTALYSVALPAGGAPALLRTVNIAANALLREPEGTYLLGGRDQQGQTTGLVRVDLAANTVVSFPQFPSGCGFIGGLGIDPVTNDLLIAWGCLNPGISNTSSLWRLAGRSTTSPLLLVSNGPPGGWGAVFSGFVTTSALHDYGRPTGTPVNTRWLVAPNLGGAPMPGNLGFQIQTTAPVGAFSIGVGDFAAGNGNLPLPGGLTAWLGGASMIVVPATTTGTTATVPLAIPANPWLSGFEVYLQTFHFVAPTLLSASSGLRVRVQ